MRKFLFISYATEDQAFADWLYQKLTIYGYNVWLDKYNLKKGESFPEAFPQVIKEETIRFIPILTEASLKKANPRKERTTAHNVKSHIGDQEFILPIRLGKINPIDLDHFTVDLNWIDFSVCWSKGLEELLLSLESNPLIPRNSMPFQLESSFNSKFALPEKSEVLYTNILNVEALPQKVFRLKKKDLEFPLPWYLASEFQDSYYALSLEDDLKAKATLVSVEDKISDEPAFKNVFKGLIQKAVNDNVYKKGLRTTMEKGLYSFPDDVIPTIKYVNSNLKNTYIRTKGNVKKAIFRLAVKYTFVMDHYGEPKIRVNFKFIFFTEHGMPLSPKMAFKKQSKLRKAHYNSRWLQKIFALSSFFVEGEKLFKLLDSDCGMILVNGSVDNYETDQGIIEDKLKILETDSFINQESGEFQNENSSIQ